MRCAATDGAEAAGSRKVASVWALGGPGGGEGGGGDGGGARRNRLRDRRRQRRAADRRHGCRLRRWCPGALPARGPPGRRPGAGRRTHPARGRRVAVDADAEDDSLISCSIVPTKRDENTISSLSSLSSLSSSLSDSKQQPLQMQCQSLKQKEKA